MLRILKTICLLVALLALRALAWAAPLQLDVRAEHQKLRTVLVHQPGRGLGRVTRSNVKQMLFEHPVDDWAKARDEHVGLQEALRSRGIEVLKVGDLLKDVLEKPTARMSLIDQALKTTHGLDARRQLELGRVLASLDSAHLADVMTEGMTQAELQKLSGLPLWKNTPELVLPAHVNLMFTRDTTKVVGNALAFSSMATDLRNHEARLLKSIIKLHPRFAGTRMLEDQHGAGFDAIEGGDMLVIDRDTLLVGVGERTQPKAVMAYAKELFARGLAKKVVMTPLPNKGSMFHTDTIMNRVSEDAMLIHPVVKQLRSPMIFTPDGKGGVKAERSRDDLLDTLARVTGRARGWKTIAPHDERTANLEQELDGTNVLPVSNGVVIGYKHNVANNAALEKANIEVIPFDGEQLVRGRGGPHCLTRPIR